jgi:hypothetical protein
MKSKLYVRSKISIRQNSCSWMYVSFVRLTIIRFGCSLSWIVKMIKVSRQLMKMTNVSFIWLSRKLKNLDRKLSINHASSVNHNNIYLKHTLCRFLQHYHIVLLYLLSNYSCMKNYRHMLKYFIRKQ